MTASNRSYPEMELRRRELLGQNMELRRKLARNLAEIEQIEAAFDVLRQYGEIVAGKGK